MYLAAYAYVWGPLPSYGASPRSANHVSPQAPKAGSSLSSGLLPISLGLSGALEAIACYCLMIMLNFGGPDAS